MSDGDERATCRPAPEAADDGGTPAPVTDEAAAEAAAEMASEAAPEPEPDPTPEEVIADLKDQLLRAMAETENVRRRAQRELADARKYAVADFARDLLVLADNLDRAIASAGPEQGALLEGVELSRRQFLQALEKFGIRAIDAEGRKLDPNLHQAMLQVPTAEAEPGTVVQVLQVGYTIHDRLLRPALVGVAAAPAPTTDDRAEAGAASDDPDA